MYSADEWKKFGLHFAYFVFQGLQDGEYLESFKNLTLAIKTLLGPTVRRSDINQAENQLGDFVREYEVFKSLSN